MNGGYCTSCGIKTAGNIQVQKNDRILTCDCGYSMRFYIISTQNKTDTEVDESFQKTKLTHKQQFG